MSEVIMLIAFFVSFFCGIGCITHFFDKKKKPPLIIKDVIEEMQKAECKTLQEYSGVIFIATSSISLMMSDYGDAHCYDDNYEKIFDGYIDDCKAEGTDIVFYLKGIEQLRLTKEQHTDKPVRKRNLYY